MKLFWNNGMFAYTEINRELRKERKLRANAKFRLI